MDSQDQRDRGLIGRRVGHIRIDALLGRGGMGEVYRGFDETLQRAVAVKALYESQRLGTQAKARLLREARLLSRLDHPGICRVYELIEEDGCELLVLEYIEGRTLSAMGGLDEQQVLRIARDVAEALAVAHREGIVHRDLKPDNVMVTPGGDVKVLDFGIARLPCCRVEVAEEEPSPELPPPHNPDGAVTVADREPTESIATEWLAAQAVDWDDPTTSNGGPLVTALTRCGGIVGTPRFMSPEQAGGGAITTASDLYSFGVMLQELLTGRPAYAGDPDGAELLLMVYRGETVVPDGVDTELRTLLGELTRVNPQSRPSAEETARRLQRVLDRPLRRRRLLRRIAAAVLAIVAVVALGYAIKLHRSRSEVVCSGGQDRIETVWSPARRELLRAAFDDTGAAFAGESWAAVTAALDRYTKRWLAVYAASCESVRVRGEGSEALLDRQIACLDQRLREVDALLELLADADAALLADAHEAVGSLVAVEACADTTGLSAEVPPPENPELRQRIDRLREDLARVEALRATGEYSDGLELAASLIPEADEIGYAPLLAEVYGVCSYFEMELSQLDAAELSCRRAFVEAERGGSDRMAAEVGASLADIAVLQARIGEARWWVEVAEAMSARIDADPKLRRTILMARSETEMAAGEHDAARAAALAALELAAASYGADSMETAEAHTLLANTLSSLAEYDEALEHYQEALRLVEAILGPRHPSVAYDLNNLGYCLLALGRRDEAETILQQALAVEDETLGIEHPARGATLNNLAQTVEEMGRVEDALAYIDQSLEARRLTVGTSHPAYAISLLNRAGKLRTLGRLDEALATSRIAAEVFERALGPDHQSLGYALNAIGVILGDLGRPAEALPYVERSLAIGVDDPKILGTRQETLAKTIVDAGGDRARARALVAAARASYQEAGERGRAELAELEDWVAAGLPKKGAPTSAPSR